MRNPWSKIFHKSLTSFRAHDPPTPPIASTYGNVRHLLFLAGLPSREAPPAEEEEEGEEDDSLLLFLSPARRSLSPAISGYIVIF